MLSCLGPLCWLSPTLTPPFFVFRDGTSLVIQLPLRKAFPNRMSFSISMNAKICNRGYKKGKNSAAALGRGGTALLVAHPDHDLLGNPNFRIRWFPTLLCMEEDGPCDCLPVSAAGLVVVGAAPRENICTHSCRIVPSENYDILPYSELSLSLVDDDLFWHCRGPLDFLSLLHYPRRYAWIGNCLCCKFQSAENCNTLPPLVLGRIFDHFQATRVWSLVETGVL